MGSVEVSFNGVVGSGFCTCFCTGYPKTGNSNSGVQSLLKRSFVHGVGEGRISACLSLGVWKLWVGAGGAHPGTSV